MDIILYNKIQKTDARVDGAESVLYPTFTGYDNPNLCTGFASETDDGGITWTKVSDSKITVSGTSTKQCTYRFYFDNSSFPAWLKKGKQYYVSYHAENVYLEIEYYKPNYGWQTLYNSKESATFMVPENSSGINIALRVYTNITVDETVEVIITNTPIYEELVKNTDESASKITNPNLCVDYQSSIDDGGIIWGRIAPNKILVTGHSTKNVRYRFFFKTDSLPNWLEKGKTYFVKYNASLTYLDIEYYTTEWITLYNGRKSCAFTVPSDANGFSIALIVYNDVGVNEIVEISITESPIESVLYDGGIVSPVSLKICTYNVGLYNCGSSDLDRPNLQLKEQMMRKFLADNNFDIVCNQEHPNVQIGEDETNKTFNAYRLIFPYLHHSEPYETIWSKYLLRNKQTGYFTAAIDDNQRKWQSADVYINGIQVTLFNCHPTYQNTEEGAATRQLQFEEIIETLLADKENAILFGDFNTRSISEFDIFIENGYQILNGGYLGTFLTNGAATTATAPLDNIIIKGDHVKGYAWRADALFDSGHVGNVDYYVSDHYPLVGNVVVF